MERLKMGPFVKWAGGKKQIVEKLRQSVPARFRTYYEPFLGGGAFLLELQPPKAVLNDVNRQLWNAYVQLQKNDGDVIAKISAYDSMPCDKKRYLAMRDAYNQKITAGELDAECAAMLIWLNKHCFNGLYRVNQKGLFNVPYNNKTDGPSMREENLRNIGTYLRAADIEIRTGDFEAACADVREGDFVYFDPPYVPAGKTANFTHYAKGGFSREDQRRLAELFRRLDALGAYVLSSNHDAPLVRELYGGYRMETETVRRNISRDASRRSGQEVIISNFTP